MSSTTTGTRAVRLPNELIEYIDHDIENPLRKVIESLYGLVWAGKLKLVDGNVQIPGEITVSKDIVADFEVILSIYDTNFEDFFKKLYKKVANCEIDVDEIMK